MFDKDLCSSCEKMIERYYNVSQMMLTAIGLWPYQKKRILRIQGSLVLGILAFFIFFQLTTFVTTSIDADYIIKEFSYIFLTCVYSLNYNSFYFNRQNIKRFVEHIKTDWSFLSENYEIEILKKYTYQGYVFGILTSGFTFFFFFTFILFEMTPVILDIVKPLNESRPRTIEVPFEFFIFNENDHFFICLSFEIIVLTIGIWSLLSTGAFLFMMGRHFCATYKIASILIENTVTEGVMQIPVSQRMYLMYQKIHRGVIIHRRTMELVLHISFINEQLHTFHLWYFPMIVVGAVSLSCVFFRMINAVTRSDILHNEKDFYQFFISFALFLGHLSYMFVANLCVQLLIDHSAKVWEAIFQTLWYIAPLSIQKMILFMQLAIKEQKLVVGGVFVPCLEGFATLFTSAISYFTVIYTLRGY